MNFDRMTGDASAGTCPDLITRTWTATDACGNVGMAVQLITVEDTTAPTVTAPLDATVDCSIDVSDPARPATLGSMDMTGAALEVAVAGGMAYVAESLGFSGGALRVIDVTDADKVLVEAERNGITAKGTAWLDPDGQVVLRSQSTLRAFP